MKKNVLLLAIVLLLVAGLPSQAQDSGNDPLPVRLVNTGRMAIAANGTSGVALYVPYSVLMADPYDDKSRVSIYQSGISSIGGSFYQESKSNVFQVDTDGWGTSGGSVIFSGDDPSGDRFVRTRDADDMEAFQRAAYYVAFPHLVIGTDNLIHIPGRMGIDAASVNYRTGDEEGILYLYSDLDESGTKVFDASLRISATGVEEEDRTSEKLVAAGSVIIERDVSIYRSNTDPLFPFASPFTNQRAGYFAGNFVRQFLEETSYAGHVEYVLGNKDADSDGWIDADQYLQEADELFVPGKGYLIKPRPHGYDYSQLPFDQTDGTAATLYDKGKFIFKGNVYNLEDEVKQVFSEDILFGKELSGENYDKTVNWIIGNSYTSALSLDKVYNEMASTGLNLSSTIYLYPAGSTAYVPYSFSSSAVNMIDLPDIPSMTYVMVRLSKGKAQTGEFVVDRSFQTHGELSNNFLRSKYQYSDELVFRVSPEDNPNVYDLSMIALREKTSGAIAKVSNPQKDAFQLYAASKMSIAVETDETLPVALSFIPSSGESRYTLSVSRVESMATEAVLLEDRVTGEWTDLRETNSYPFETAEGDPEERFFVHFVSRKGTGWDDMNDMFLTCYYSQNFIKVRGIDQKDLGSILQVSDTQGRILFRNQITSIPEQQFEASLPTGIYIVSIIGERNRTVKIIEKGGKR